MDIGLDAATAEVLQRQAVDRGLTLGSWIKELTLEHELDVNRCGIQPYSEPITTIMTITEDSDPDERLYSDDLAERFDDPEIDEVRIKQVMKNLNVSRNQDWERTWFHVGSVRKTVHSARSMFGTSTS